MSRRVKWEPRMARCANCGGEFLQKSRWEKTCSVACRAIHDEACRKANAENRQKRRAEGLEGTVWKTCAVCGKPLKNNYQKYCSDECIFKAGKRPRRCRKPSESERYKRYKRSVADEKRAAKERLAARDAEYAAAFGADERTDERGGVVTVTRGRIPGGNRTPRTVFGF